MSAIPVFLDVNVPMYAAGASHAYKESCTWVLAEVAEGRLSAAIDTEIIQEVLYRYHSLKRQHLALEMASSLLELVPAVYPITMADIVTALQLFEQYGAQEVRVRDLIHAAVMQNNGLTQIISTDSHFDQITGITRLDPQHLFEKHRSIER